MNERTEHSIILAAGTCSGFAAYTAAGKYLNKGTNAIFSKLYNNNLNPQEVVQIRQAAQKALRGEKLDEYGISVVDCSKKEGLDFLESEKKEFLSPINKKIENVRSPLYKRFLIYVRNMRDSKFERAKNVIINGENAFYVTKRSGKYVAINMEKGPEMIMHEFGHAINHRSLSPFGETLVYKYLRGKNNIKRALLAIFLISMLTDKQKDEDKTKNSKVNRAAQFVKNNCGKLAFAICTPLLIEETIASINGQKLGKKYLDPKYMKFLTKSHMHSFSSYFASAVLSGAVMYLSNVVRDFTVDLCHKQRLKHSEKIKHKPLNYQWNSVNIDNFSEFVKQ